MASDQPGVNPLPFIQHLGDLFPLYSKLFLDKNHALGLSTCSFSYW